MKMTKNRGVGGEKSRLDDTDVILLKLERDRVLKSRCGVWMREMDFGGGPTL